MAELLTKPNLHLPEEVIEQILPEIELQRDLVSFACASQFFRHLVIPRHTEYRLLRIGTTDDYAHIWAHLARRPDLACTIREIVIEVVKTVDLCQPTSLIEDVDRERRPREVEQEEMLQSLGSMYRLKLFSWDHRTMAYPYFAPAVFDVLQRVGSFKHFCLDIFDSIEFNKPVEECGLWKMSGLRSLKIEVDDEDWLLSSNSELVPNWLNSLSSLEFLSLSDDMFYTHHKTLFFPSLKRFSISAWNTNPSHVNNILRFLERHPQLEELKYFTHFNNRMHVLPSDFLPHLRQLDCSDDLFQLLIAEPKCRRLHSLSIRRCAKVFDDLCTTPNIDRQCLRYIGVDFAPNYSQLRNLAITFSGIEKLSIRYGVEDQLVDFETIPGTLAQFRGLKMLHGDLVWKDLNITRNTWKTDISNEDARLVEERIQMLARPCPNLVQLPHPRSYNHVYMLSRDNEEVIPRVQKVKKNIFTCV